ncbi:MAG: TetR/AcrR family transcriptional regulator, partial [Acidobacteria bacterium]|nr:TetR/AcrR family transcriptional regulator [Acidobacteriota bacterium]
MKKSDSGKKPRDSAKESIRKAATRLFAEKGFAATSTREICQRAGITKPVLYYHFGNKEQLFRDLILDACNESRKQLLLASQRGKTSLDKLIDVIAADFALTRRNPSLSRMLFRMIFAPEKGSPDFDYIEMGMEWLRLLEGLVAEGIRRREMKGRAREIAEAIMGLHTLYTMGFLLTGEPKLGRPLAQRMVRLLLKGCRGKST